MNIVCDWQFTWTIEQNIVILHVTQTLLEPIKVVRKVLHAEDETSIRTKAQRVILHDVLDLDQLTDVYGEVNIVGTRTINKHRCIR